MLVSVGYSICIVFVIVNKLFSSVILFISGLVSRKWNFVSNDFNGCLCGCGGGGNVGRFNNGSKVINVFVVVSL